VVSGVDMESDTATGFLGISKWDLLGTKSLKIGVTT